MPQPTNCRLISFDAAEVRPGIIENTWFLIVTGMKPWLTMQVELHSLIYIRQPDYWGIEVVGCLEGIGLPVDVPYHVALDISHTRGKKGIEVIGANQKKQIDIP
jgi:hypothetical protein